MATKKAKALKIMTPKETEASASDLPSEPKKPAPKAKPKVAKTKKPKDAAKPAPKFVATVPKVVKAAEEKFEYTALINGTRGHGTTRYKFQRNQPVRLPKEAGKFFKERGIVS